jgi:hypothetical protein
VTGSGRVLTAGLLLAPLLAAVPAPAEAYLDPGTGSYVFQMLVATAVSLGFILKAYWRRIVGLFTRWRRGETPPPPDVG